MIVVPYGILDGAPAVVARFPDSRDVPLNPDLSGIHRALELVSSCFESRFIGAAINRRTTRL